MREGVNYVGGVRLAVRDAFGELLRRGHAGAVRQLSARGAQSGSVYCAASSGARATHTTRA